ncbi:MAG: YggS family pyridoxal phosphate-dependent enzyme [Chromatiales bacterium]|nr:MAG: YggS family pyridoxal phosphate-dependent enzyme [Chromatiales bacterium]
MARFALTITGRSTRHSIATGQTAVVTRITEQLARLRGRIEAAAQAAGRDPAAVRILAVSKRQPAERIAAALAAGIRDLGENYLQEALQKMPAYGKEPVWHFVGHVQSNKSRSVAEHFDWLHTVDSKRLADRLAAQRPAELPPLQVLIQVAPRGGESRGGVPPQAVPELAHHVAGLPGLQLRGLMVMPLAGRSDAELHAEFAAGRELLATLCADGLALDTLSMGMSNDLEAAVQEGATVVRIGTDLFGPRET